MMDGSLIAIDPAEGTTAHKLRLQCRTQDALIDFKMTLPWISNQETNG